MSLQQLLAYVAPEQRAEVERRYAAFTAGSRTLADEHIDSFAKVLSERGLVSTDGLHEFLTYRALMVSPFDADEPSGPRTEGARYELMTIIGRGGMGEVFLGTEPNLKRTVAIKRLTLAADGRPDPTAYRRFVTEAQVTAQLDHPAIMPVYGFERDADGTLAYAMKFVRGVTLAQFIDETEAQSKARGRPDATHSLKARVETFVPILNALAYAHRRGVIHRDLKPENIMVGRFGEVLVMDWGIARLVGPRPQAGTSPEAPDTTTPFVAIDPGARAARAASQGERATRTEDAITTSDTALTRVGAILGTPDFMSPEQARGETLDAASDQYALGLMLQELVTLRAAIPGRDSDAILERAKRGEHLAVTVIGGSNEPVPRELRSIIAKATAFAKADRYPTVEAMADDVRHFLRDESVAADPDSGLRRMKRWIGNHRGAAMAVGLGLLMLFGAVAAFILWRGELALEAERQQAHERERTIVQLGGQVDTRSKRMTEQLHGYEMLLNELATAARIYLSEPAPPSDVVVYSYRKGHRDPPELPADAIDSKIYRQKTSVRHADFTAAPEVDRQAARGLIDQLARLEPVLRSTLLASADKALNLPIDQAETLVLQTGVPLVWSYFAAANGLSIGMPGTWHYEDSPGSAGYDHRKEGWYLEALRYRDIYWSTGPDENGLGLLLGATQVVRDRDDKVLGVAAVDLAMHHLIDAYLEIPELARAGAEALLIDRAGRVQVRSTQKEVARSARVFVPLVYEEPLVVVGIKAADVGHVVVPDGRLAVWSALGRVGLFYVVIGPEAALLDVVRQANPN